MATRFVNESRNSTRARGTYVNGAAAPQFEPEKIREAKREYIERTQSVVEERVVQNRLAAREFSKKQLVVFALCTAVLLAAVALYLVMLSNVHKAEQKVDRLKMEYNLLLKENELVQDEIAAGIDYAEVYRVATDELGMGIAQKNQMVVYDRPETEYVVKVAESK